MCKDLLTSFEEDVVTLPEPRHNASRGISVEEAGLASLVLVFDAQVMQEAHATVIEERADVVISSPVSKFLKT